MLLAWKIRYLDSRDKEIKDRSLWLDTETLGPAMRAAMEATVEMKESGGGREWLNFQHLFSEDDPFEDAPGDTKFRGSFSTVGPLDYFEDENGNELTSKQMAVILTDNPNAVMFPAGTKQYEIDFVRAEQRSIRLDQISLSSEQLTCLGYFVRDLRELFAAALFKDGPGTLGLPPPFLSVSCNNSPARRSALIFTSAKRFCISKFSPACLL